MIIQKLQLLFLYIQYSVMTNGHFVQCQTYIASFQKWILLPWSHFTVSYGEPLMQEGLNQCFDQIVEFETARTRDGNLFSKALLSR